MRSPTGSLGKPIVLTAIGVVVVLAIMAGLGSVGGGAPEQTSLISTTVSSLPAATSTLAPSTEPADSYPVLEEAPKKPGFDTNTTNITPASKEALLQGEEVAEIVASPVLSNTSPAARSEGPLRKGEEPPEFPELPTSAQGQVYTWEDGDRTRQARLQSNLTLVGDQETPSEDTIVRRQVDGHIVRAEPGQGKGQPVFRSESGALMTLPGGVLVVLDPEWDRTRVNTFFQSNQIKMSRVSPLGLLPNAYLIATEPGFPSLNLANTLAKQEGVEVSSPNWWTESVSR